MENTWNIIDGLKPAMIMVVVQVLNTGLNIFYKLATNDGMSLRVMVAYRFLFATAFMLPLALYLERKSRPKLTWLVVFQAFICGLLGGSLNQNLYAKALVLTSATFASATTNLVPVITFAMSIYFGLETLGLGNMAGKAKLMGTLVSIGGATLLTLYKGPELDLWSTRVDILDESQHHARHVANHAWGSFFAIGSCFSCAASMIIQAKMSKRYPCHYSSTALIAIMGSLQGVIFALCTEKDWSQWQLGWDIKLLTVAYGGIVASGIVVFFMMWCMNMRGPVFVTAFGPLMPVLTAIAGSLVLDEKLHVGSVVGAVLIIFGLYLVLWGKSKEKTETSTDAMNSKESRETKISIHSLENNNNGD